METALGTPLPYWESPIDFDMEEPTLSILWTERYFGNGIGMVETGPFANFDTPLGPLFRNIGSDGMLMNRTLVKLIFTKENLSQIVEPTADPFTSLEGQHNGVHVWVDGLMNNIEWSPHDPVFFRHHAYIDFVWELFRVLQVSRGVDPSQDTVEPPPFVTFQLPDDPAVGLLGYYNSDGYSHRIAKMVFYAASPKCPTCAHSNDLYCDRNGGNICMCKEADPRAYEGTRQEAYGAAVANDMLPNGRNFKPFPMSMRDSRVRLDSVTGSSPSQGRPSGLGVTGV